MTLQSIADKPARGLQCQWPPCPRHHIRCLFYHNYLRPLYTCPYHNPLVVILRDVAMGADQPEESGDPSSGELFIMSSWSALHLILKRRCDSLKSVTADQGGWALSTLNMARMGGGCEGPNTRLSLQCFVPTLTVQGAPDPQLGSEGSLLPALPIPTI